MVFVSALQLIINKLMALVYLVTQLANLALMELKMVVSNVQIQHFIIIIINVNALTENQWIAIRKVALSAQ